MAITYSYQIHELKEVPTLGNLNNVITEVVYTYVGTNEDGIISPYPGRTKLLSPNPESFKPTVELTEEDVIEWLEAHADLEIMKRSIQQHIEQQSGTILRGSTLPWAPTEEVAPVSGSI
jgi:hypothetical protein